jgi:hypothetical protein
MLSTDPPLANPEDMNIPQCVANAEEAIALIRKHHALWLRKYGGKPGAEKAVRKTKPKSA